MCENSVISSIKFLDEYTLVSADYDGYINIFDLRKFSFSAKANTNTSTFSNKNTQSNTSKYTTHLDCPSLLTNIPCGSGISSMEIYDKQICAGLLNGEILIADSGPEVSLHDVNGEIVADFPGGGAVTGIVPCRSDDENEPYKHNFLAVSNNSTNINRFNITSQDDCYSFTAIEGKPHYTKIQVMSDKQHYATLDSHNTFKIFNVLSLKCTEKVDNVLPNQFENTCKRFDKFVWVPSWFTVDLRLGRPTVCLEYSEYSSAWVYMDNETERKNLGIQMAKIIHCSNDSSDKLSTNNSNRLQHNSGHSSSHSSTSSHRERADSNKLSHNQQYDIKPVKNLHCFYSSQTGKTLQQAPRWWENWPENEKNAKTPPKNYFYLRDKKYEKEDIEKSENDCLDLSENDKLSANNTCLIKKIAHHVFKMIEKREEDLSEDEAFRKYIITCNGRELIATNDLRTIYYRIWSPTRTGLPIIYYERVGRRTYQQRSM